MSMSAEQSAEQHTDQLSGVHKSTPSAWASVILMVVGFLLCTLGFIIDNNLILWIAGGVLGFIGIVLARVSNIMEQSH